MFDFIKNLFKNPKSLVIAAVDSLDAAVPILADELDQQKSKQDFLKWSSTQQAQWAVDFFQAWIKRVFKLS